MKNELVANQRALHWHEASGRGKQCVLSTEGARHTGLGQSETAWPRSAAPGWYRSAIEACDPGCRDRLRTDSLPATTGIVPVGRSLVGYLRQLALFFSRDHRPGADGAITLLAGVRSADKVIAPRRQAPWSRVVRV